VPPAVPPADPAVPVAPGAGAVSVVAAPFVPVAVPVVVPVIVVRVSLPQIDHAMIPRSRIAMIATTMPAVELSRPVTVFAPEVFRCGASAR
jgi:hypothetical protein